MKLLSLLLLLPMLVGCHKKDPWHHSAIRNTNPHYDLAKLSYPAESAHRGIQLELIRQDQTIQGYLSVYTFEFPSLQESPQQTRITLSAGGINASFIVDRLQGGQRLHLSSESLDCLLDLLQSHTEVTVQVGHYSQIYNSSDFNRHYQKLCKLPPRLWPERIVTFDLY